MVRHVAIYPTLDGKRDPCFLSAGRRELSGRLRRHIFVFAELSGINCKVQSFSGPELVTEDPIIAIQQKLGHH